MSVSRARACDCPHGYPLCACHLGLSGPALLRRSNWLSSLAGWPGRLDAQAVADHGAAIARHADEMERLRQAETCTHRRIPECGCRGYECGPGGRRPGDAVNIRDCLACVGTRE